MPDEDIQKAILYFLYKAWRNEPFNPVHLDKLIGEEPVNATKEELYRNAEYLASKGFIKVTKVSGGFLARIKMYAL